MSKIQVLSDHAINQIAAGEVIENPASVVKELIENALDAGARKITISIEQGGLQLIRVTDDGCGMGEEDAVCCFLRFATSKIRDVDDLSRLSTMGFRGEALAAIGAISKVTLRTAENGGAGVLVEFEGGKVVNMEPCAAVRGTTFEVRSLFYNVPARKKFQKAPSQTAGEITRMVSLLALGAPEISFELFQQGELLLKVERASDLQTRVRDVLGEEFLKDSTPIDLTMQDMRIQGVLCHPLASRVNRMGQYLFINERPIQSLSISYAVKAGFGTRIEEERHPAFVLHLTLNQEILDVNVHPQKKEVRILNDQKIKDEIRRAVAKALDIRHEGASLFSKTSFVFSEIPFEEPLFPPQTHASAEELTLGLERPASTLCAFGVVGHFLLLDALTLPLACGPQEEGIFVVDLEATRRSLLFHAMQRGLSLESQCLLTPLMVAVNPSQNAILEAHLAELGAIGLQMHLAHKNRWMIDAVPPFLHQDEIEEILFLFAEECSIKEKIKGKRERRLAALCARFAHERKKTSQEEALHLFEALLKIPASNTCPEGKPTCLRIKPDEIAQLFNLKKTS